MVKRVLGECLLFSSFLKFISVLYLLSGVRVVVGSVSIVVLIIQGATMAGLLIKITWLILAGFHFYLGVLLWRARPIGFTLVQVEYALAIPFGLVLAIYPEGFSLMGFDKSAKLLMENGFFTRLFVLVGVVWSAAVLWEIHREKKLLLEHASSSFDSKSDL